MLAQLGIKGAALLIFDHGIGLSSDQWHRDVMSVVGHSRHSHIAPAPTNVRYAPNSDQKCCGAANDVMCHKRHCN
jgi:hypothetical protein